jgi:ArsR family transcriptional regulator
MNAQIRSRTDVLKVCTHPVRIAILDELLKGVKCVGDFEEFLEISQPNISQHLAALRNAGIIDFFIDGRLRCYFLKNPMIPDLLEILKKEYPEELPGPECCPVTKKGVYPGKRHPNKNKSDYTDYTDK